MTIKSLSKNINVRRELEAVKLKTSKDLYEMLETKFTKTRSHKTA